MSVLESMRSGTDSTFMQIVLAAVVVSFVGWGLGGTLNTTDTVAMVNGEKILGITYGRRLAMAERQAESRSPEPLSEDARNKLRADVLDAMIRERALLQEAHDMGLEVSDAEVANELLSIEWLKDADGRFDRNTYANFLRRQGLTRDAFEEQLREDLLLRKLRGLAMLGASVSEPVVKRQWIADNTKVDVRFVRIASTTFRGVQTPDAAALDAWATEHAAEVQAAYDADLERLYKKPAQVRLRLIRLAIGDDGLSATDLKPKLDAVKAEIEGGADFGELAKRWSEDVSAPLGGELGEQPVSALPAEVAEKLEGVADGALSDIIVTATDLRLYQVLGRTEARTIPLAEVREALAERLYREQEAPRAAAAFAEQELLPAWKAAQEPPEELLEAKGLKVTSTGPLTARSLSQGLFRPPAAMLEAARSAAEGDVFDEVYEEGGVYYVGQLTSRTEADAEALAEELPQVMERALLQRRFGFYQGWEDDVVKGASVTRYTAASGGGAASGG